MGKLKFYIAAMRLRTLPLSLAGVLLGLMLAYADYHLHWTVFVSTALTTVFLQILSNVSNELGDAMRGTDSADRQGPAYTLSMGFLSQRDFKIMIPVYIVLCVLSGLSMIYCSFGTLFSLESVMLMLLGAAAISGAMRYTLGRNPYGYRGLGDIYVFAFFGLAAVLGAYFVASHTLHWKMLLPGISMGAFSVGVLNVNNIRDMKTDAATRVTVPLKIGERNAKIYHTCLIAAGWASMLVYVSLRMFDPWHYLFVLTLPLFIVHVRGVWKRSGKDLDPMLPLLVMSSFAFASLCGLGFLVYLF